MIWPNETMHYIDFATGLDSIGVHYTIEKLYKDHPSELGNALEAELVIRKLTNPGFSPAFVAKRCS